MPAAASVIARGSRVTERRAGGSTPPRTPTPSGALVTLELLTRIEQMANADTIYHDRLLNQVRGALDAGVHSFRELCRACEGAFPTEVAYILENLRVEFGYEPLTSTLPESGVRSFYDDEWLEPSPADYEWRFTADTAEQVAELAHSNGSRIVCIGTPTVFKVLIEFGADAYLIDRNPYLPSAFPRVQANRLIVADIKDVSANSVGRQFDVVVMDPPWYPLHTMFWLMKSEEIATPTGTILFPLFPELVRPSAMSERADILATINSIGKVKLGVGEVMYETPLFEREALSALRIPTVGDWRTAGVVSIALHRARPILKVTAPEEVQWERYRFGNQIVAVRKSTESGGGISVTSPYPSGSFLLRSVSARDSVRERIDVWTSRNRVAEVVGIDRVRPFLRDLELNYPPNQAIERWANDDSEKVSLERLVTLIGW